MKTLFVILLVSISLCTYSQTPQAFNYQAVLRDDTGNVIANQEVSLQFSIMAGSVDGTPIYQETHFTKTNQFGLVNLQIGNGMVSTGSFSLINWGDNIHFLQIAMDNTGGTNFTVMGTSQLLSVPYALHARTVELVDYSETDPIFNASIAKGITGVDTTTWNAKLDSFSETDPIFGASVVSRITGTDTTNWNNKLDTEVDGSVTNEMQTISRTGLTVTLTDGGSFSDSVNVFTGDMQNQKIINSSFLVPKILYIN